MLEPGKLQFRNFSVEIKKRPIPDSFLVLFSGSTDIDSRGWETPSGDRKKFEDDFKFMWNPYDAPSGKKGEYVVKFSSEERLKKFAEWLDNQIRQYGGVIDDI
jgi:hypothetical protein